LQLNCSSNQITVSYDGTQVINTTDTEATAYLSGGISVDLWTDVTGYSMFVDNVVVNSLSGGSQPLARPIQQIVISPPFIQSVALNDGAAVVTWRANPGTVYRLQF